MEYDLAQPHGVLNRPPKVSGTRGNGVRAPETKVQARFEKTLGQMRPSSSTGACLLPVTRRRFKALRLACRNGACAACRRTSPPFKFNRAAGSLAPHPGVQRRPSCFDGLRIRGDIERAAACLFNGETQPAKVATHYSTSTRDDECPTNSKKTGGCQETR